MKTNTDSNRPGGAAAKKPYQKPAFEREEVFETMALACAKTNQGTPHGCKGGSNKS